MYAEPQRPLLEQLARPAGALYLIIAVAGGYSMGYLPAVLNVTGDAAATAHNFVTHSGMVRLGIAGDMIVMIAELAATALLYMMFKQVNPTLSLIAALARISMAIVMGVNLALKLASLSLAKGGGAFAAFDRAQLDALSLLFNQIHQNGVYIWGLFFGIHLLILGWLVLKSGAFPRLLGVLMMIGSFGYIVETLQVFLFPDIPALVLGKNILLAIVVIAELSFALWLLIKGAAAPK